MKKHADKKGPWHKLTRITWTCHNLHHIESTMVNLEMARSFSGEPTVYQSTRHKPYWHSPSNYFWNRSVGCIAHKRKLLSRYSDKKKWITKFPLKHMDLLWLSSSSWLWAQLNTLCFLFFKMFSQSRSAISLDIQENWITRSELQ